MVIPFLASILVIEGVLIYRQHNILKKLKNEIYTSSALINAIDKAIEKQEEKIELLKNNVEETNKNIIENKQKTIEYQDLFSEWVNGSKEEN